MSFPLYYLLILYFIFLAVWLVFFIVALYHVFRFGFKTFTTFFITFVFILITVSILATSYEYISQIDWEMQVSVLEGLFDNNIY